MAALELNTFVGEWSDSLGHDVRVTSGGRGIQVSLRKPNGRGKDITLTIKKVGSHFHCGHYDLDEKQSWYDRVVWIDRRRQDSRSVWTRKGSEGKTDRHSGKSQEQSHSSWNNGDWSQSQNHSFPPAPPAPPLPPGNFVPPPPGNFSGVSAHAAPAGNLAHPSSSSTTGASKDSGSGDSEVWRPPPVPPSAHASASWTAQQSATGSYWPSSSSTAPVPAQPDSRKTEPKHEDAADMFHVLNILTHTPVKQEDGSISMPASASGSRSKNEAPPSPGGMSDATVPSDGEDETQSQRPAVLQRSGPPPSSQDEERWSAVLDMLSAAGGVDASANADPRRQQQQAQQPQQHQYPQQQYDPRQYQQLGMAQSYPQMQQPAFPPAPPGAPVFPPVPPTATGFPPPPPPAPLPPAPTAPGQGAKLEDLFSSFGLPQQVVSQAPSGAAAAAAAAAGTTAADQEALRESVLTETIARLLREKTGGGSLPPWRQSAAASAPAPKAKSEEADVPLTDIAKGAKPGAAPDPASSRDPRLAPPPPPAPPAVAAGDASPAAGDAQEPEDKPLQKFIQIFGLDELAAKCLMKLQDDEAAFVIESCQHRLKYAANPSAVVMIAIKGVAAKVGRRYYGSREAGESAAGGSNKPMELQMFEGSPAGKDEEEDAVEGNVAVADPYGVAGTDPYGGALAEDEDEEEEEEEEEMAVDQVVDAEALPPAAKRPRIAEETPPEPRLTVEVLPPPPVAVEDDAEEDAEEDGDAENLFFVDTGANV
eukprot:TRINITY_DN1515_c1_g1_i1.p1 TRINITY_DN1515_c1_g1~~TRINITY_DN1515_c1_g1_i1.p1  ORF type:complete len:761 (-),score=235.48 TRINITY_DN1515_c1_g1_i1:293-2575(-)